MQGCDGTGKIDPASIAAAILRRDKQIQKVLLGTFPVEDGGRCQNTLKSFRKSPGCFQYAHKCVVRGVIRSKHARRRHGRSADKIRHIRLRTRLRRDKGGRASQRLALHSPLDADDGLPSIARRATEGSSEKGFTMTVRGRTRHTHLSWLQKITTKNPPRGGINYLKKAVLQFTLRRI